MSKESLSHAMQECIQICLDTHRICLETWNYCLERGERFAHPSNLRMLTDCAEICQVAANFMLRNSDLYMAVCATCAEICDNCADEFEQFEGEEHLRTAAHLCRHCADLCDQIAEEPESMAA